MTTQQATACKAEQRTQAWPQRLNRVRSAVTQKVNAGVAPKACPEPVEGSVFMRPGQRMQAVNCGFQVEWQGPTRARPTKTHAGHAAYTASRLQLMLAST